MYGEGRVLAPQFMDKIGNYTVRYTASIFRQLVGFTFSVIVDLIKKSLIVSESKQINLDIYKIVKYN